MMKLTKHILTDWDNLTYDTGRVLGVVALGTAIFLAGWTVIVLKVAFDAVAFLGGTGGFLTGLGIYLYGDGKSRPTTTIKE